MFSILMTFCVLNDLKFNDFNELHPLNMEHILVTLTALKEDKFNVVKEVSFLNM